MSSILLVEDEAVIRESLTQILRSEGYEVTAREDAKDIPQLINKHPFDVMIIDLKLPGINGIDLIRKISKKPLDSEIIIITGYGTMESVIDALKLGVYDYIRKPFEPAVIMNTVKRAAEKVELRRQKTEADKVIRSLKDFNEEMLESSQEAIIVLDRDIICRYWNSATEKLSGIKRKKVLGKNLMHEKVWVLGRGLPRQFQMVLNGNVVEKVTTAISPEKKHLTFKQKLSPLRDPDGKVKGILVFMTDVTWVKAAEIKKEDLKRRSDIDLKRINCLYNISRSSETDETLGAFFNSSVNHVVDALGRQGDVKAEIAFNGEIYGSAEFDCPAKVFSAEMDAGTFGKGELRVCIGGNGLTEKKKEMIASVAERIGEVIMRRESAAQVLYERRMAGIGRLAGGLAHNLNNILGGILGYASFIRSELSTDSPLHSYLSTIEESSNLAAEITNQLLEISGSPKTLIDVIDINENINRLINLMRLFFDRNIIISSNPEPDLRYVKGDSFQLDRVFINICLNAREALQTGGRLSIETSNVEIEKGDETAGLKPGKYVLITFGDTGVGMDEEALQNCFDPFYSTKGLGYGLGLSSAYGIVREHRGSIRVRSKLGSGTTVSVYLPASGRAAKRKRPVTVSADEMTVLVVDNEELIRKMLFDGLRRLGYKVIQAEDGDEAISIFRKRAKEIDVVLLDPVMPGMDYRKIYREIKKTGKNVGIVLSSGYRLPPDVSRMVSEEGALFIQKPYKMNQLSTVIQQAIKPKDKGSGRNGKSKKQGPRS